MFSVSSASASALTPAITHLTRMTGNSFIDSAEARLDVGRQTLDFVARRAGDQHERAIASRPDDGFVAENVHGFARTARARQHEHGNRPARGSGQEGAG